MESIISNETNCTEAEELTDGELSEQYYLLKKQYQDLSRNYESTKQELHDTKRSYDNTVDTHIQLSEEIDSLQADKERNRCELNSRITALHKEISQFSVERTEVLNRHATEIKKYEYQVLKLMEEQAIKDRNSPKRDNSELNEARAAVNVALQQAAEAKTLFEEAKMEVMSWRLKFEELVSEIGEMRAAAKIKREELGAVRDREAVVFEELAEVKAMLYLCIDSQDLEPHADEGNSIFAEVEGKRQEVANNLVQTQQASFELHIELDNMQAEVEALLHEKRTVCEQRAAESAHYDRELIESYEERITQLEGLCEIQRREIARWVGKLDASNAKRWLHGVLNHLKSECTQLRVDVPSIGARQLASAVQVRDLRLQLALLARSRYSAQHSPPNQDDTTKQDIAVTKMPAQIKKRSIDYVKNKVSFN